MGKIVLYPVSVVFTDWGENGEFKRHRALTRDGYDLFKLKVQYPRLRLSAWRRLSQRLSDNSSNTSPQEACWALKLTLHSGQTSGSVV